MRQRQPRLECPAFLEFVRGHACCVCGAPPRSHPAHLRMQSLEWEKRETGKGERPSDKWVTPLCHECHLDGLYAQHKIGEKKFWDYVGIDPFALAATLYEQFEKQQRRRPPQEAHRRKRPVAKRATPKHKRKWPKVKLSGRPFGPGRKFSQQRLVERNR